MRLLVKSKEDWDALVPKKIRHWGQDAPKNYPCLAVGTILYIPNEFHGYHYIFVNLTQEGDRFFLSDY